MPERLDKHKDRSHWRERLADFAESVEKRDRKRFELLMMAMPGHRPHRAHLLGLRAGAARLHRGRRRLRARSRPTRRSPSSTLAATEELKLHLVELVEPFYVPDAAGAASRPPASWTA